MGTIVGFELLGVHRTDGSQPCGMHIMIIFDDCKVGRMTRNSAEHLPTTLRPVTATFKSKNGRSGFESYRYFTVLAWAVSLRKVQGLSLDNALTDLGQSAHGQACVALSGVKSLEGVVWVRLL